MRVISLKEFLSTGLFDTLEVGVSTKNDVISTLGSDYHCYDSDDSQIFFYNWYEFYFWKNSDILFAIQNDHLTFDCINHADMINFENDLVRIDTWFIEPNKFVTREQVIDALQIENIHFQIRPGDYPGALEYLKLENGITIDFYDAKKVFTRRKNSKKFDCEIQQIESKEDHLLNGIRLFKY